MLSYTLTIFLFLFHLIIYTDGEEISTIDMDNNAEWTIGDNDIEIHFFSSDSSEEERLKKRDDYFNNWIGLRNSLICTNTSACFEKKEEFKYFNFTKQIDYITDVVFNPYSIPCFGLMLCIIIVFIIYLVQKFLLKGCKGPKVVVKAYHYTTFAYIITGMVLGIIFLSISLYNAGASQYVFII